MKHSKWKAFNTFCIFTLLTAIFILGGLIVHESKTINDSPTAAGNISYGESKSETMKSNYPVSDETVVLNSEDAYLDNSLFIGDSRTLALALEGGIPDYNTFAENGINHVTYMSRSWTDDITGAYGTIDRIVSIRKPKRVYIALGVNGISFMDTEYFITTFRQLIELLQAASPSSTLIIEAILPVSSAYELNNPEINNSSIHEMNEIYKQLAVEYDACYLPIYECVTDDTGAMNEAYDRGDGLHYNSEGCAALAAYIKSHPIADDTLQEETAIFQ